MANGYTRPDLRAAGNAGLFERIGENHVGACFNLSRIDNHIELVTGSNGVGIGLNPPVASENIRGQNFH